MGAPEIDEDEGGNWCWQLRHRNRRCLVVGQEETIDDISVLNRCR